MAGRWARVETNYSEFCNIAGGIDCDPGETLIL